MPIARKFLDWTRPALLSAAEYLVAAHKTAEAIDLGQVVGVLPGGRAGRRLLEILVEVAERERLVLVPPQFVTAGALPELLYRPKQRFATDLEQQLAWAQALKLCNRENLGRLVRQPPEGANARGWLELADVLRRLHRELATDVLNFADVARLGREVEGFAEEERWEILAEIQEQYLHTLDDLALWDIQTARRVAIEQRECRTDKEIVLIATVDLNVAVRKMLDLVADRVTALIFAPLDLTDRFDSHGCLLAAAWEDAPLDIPSKAIVPADDAADQAEQVVRAIGQFGGRCRAEEITIGVPDELLVPQVERLLTQHELPSRWGPGRPLATTGVYRLFEAVSRYLTGGGFIEFAALARHPDVSHWLGRQAIHDDWLTQLDRYHNDHFPVRIGEEWLGDEQNYRSLKPAYEAIKALLAPLAGRTCPLGDWGRPLVDLLRNLYGDLLLDKENPADRMRLAGCQKLCETFQSLAALSPALAPVVGAAEAIELALEQLAGESIPPPADEEAIELLGWLELPLDDAPALIVTSFNDGFVPSAVNGDPFLPNALRKKLCLEDNDRRYARDAYALSVLLASRRELRLIVARRDTEKNPLSPSRLLFATDGETIAHRLREFIESSRQQSSRHTPCAVADGTRSVPATIADGTRSVPATIAPASFVVPRPRPLDKPFDRISITAFRAYLACPYRFYLGYVRGLKAIDDTADELDGGSFGTLAHVVLQRFAESDLSDSTDAEAISRLLHHELGQCIAETYGRRPAAAIAIQAQQMKSRLAAFAHKQAVRAAEGWRIEFAEPPDMQWPLEVDGQPIMLTGRIDRIDRHAVTGERAIFDYKTSDSGLAPGKTHQRAGGWIDLQLPLYRYLARGLGLAGPFQLGYVLLPKDVTKTAFDTAKWDESELAQADAAAYDVVRALRRQTFWPPVEPPPQFSEEFAAICQDGVFDKERLS